VVVVFEDFGLWHDIGLKWWSEWVVSRHKIATSTARILLTKNISTAPITYIDAAIVVPR
jgi:hypothetical protein